MTVLLDTNVVLDLLLARQPFAGDAAAIFAMAEQSTIDCLLCATTVTTIDYLLCQSLSRQESRAALARLLSLVEVALVNRSVIDAALRSGMADFEDAVLAESASLAGADVIVTRNLRDFRNSPVVALGPDEFLAQQSSGDNDDETSKDIGED